MKYALMIVLAVMGTACTVIGPSNRGVRYVFGKVESEVLEPGTHLWVPYIAGSTTVDVGIHDAEMKISSGTKDQQEATMSVTINMQLDPSKVVETVKAFGSDADALNQFLPQAQEAVNANVSKFSAEELLTKREQLKEMVDSALKERAGQYNIIVRTVAIKDLQYSAEYSRAIEQKQIAEQKAKQAEYDAVRAQKEAEGAVNTAKGQAESQKLLRATITKELLQMEAIKKWDGKFPQVMGSQSLPFLNMSMERQ